MTDPNEETVHWTSGINVLAGLWLILAPFALGYSQFEPILWNDVIVGFAIAVFAMFRAARPYHFAPLSWINFVLGIWLVLAPFILSYTTLGGGRAIWNDVTLGVIILVLAAWSAATTKPVA
ncbi:hypothetical protein CWI75_11330 [Kineobactrum sediminis]|uniref:SPW repeat-containing integral membrane domain-containing protein n=1 Tax=Kineobactrum sediminis TaxID=1905677 RepID=A0A2N5Y1U9_9GAMM|nr:SPW repeat protein [Kineobactrum sediminis]PLW82349.1 hypothetical protein CWI75_11330 [Kineobactrum sediminis]